MHSLHTSELLAVWENSLNQSSLYRPLSLISMATAEHSFDTAARLSIGQRDACLLQLLQLMFGSEMSCFAHCPECGTQIEWENKVQDLLVPSPQAQSDNNYQLEIDDYKIEFHLPDSEDLSHVFTLDHQEGSASYLLQQCIDTVEFQKEDIPGSDLPEEILEAISRQIESLDSQADIRIALTCPDCSHAWDEVFDINHYLWEKINSWAERTLLDIHKLANAYGWSEQEILSLSPVRRQLYLGLVQ